MTTTRHTAEYWTARADELRGMMTMVTDVRAQEVLLEIARDFDGLAQLEQEDSTKILKEWDANRRSDFVDSLVDAPFSHTHKKGQGK
jgi:hypothetical protein